MAGTIVVDRLESDASYASSINIASPVIVPAGSNTAPAITPSGDTNTGIFFPAADTIAFSEGGVESMRIDSSGQVGIGTASPANLLHVEKSYSGTIAKIKNNRGIASSDAGLEVETNTTAAKTLLLKNAGTETFSVLGNGELKFNSGYGSAAVAYGCRAWVNFNGTGTVAIRGSGNVTSITDNGTGDYTVNFTTAMPDANYATNLTIGSVTGGSSDVIPLLGTLSNTSVRVFSVQSVFKDAATVGVAIFR
jgi:hypothetical protein